MRKSMHERFRRTVRLVLGVAVILAGSAAEAASPLMSCSDVDQFLDRSTAAFPPSFDPELILKYPVRDALKELRTKCREGQLTLPIARDIIERHVVQTLAVSASPFTVIIVSFAWCPACATIFPTYGQLAKKHRGEVQFVFLDGDVYDGRVDPAPHSPFVDFLSTVCGLRVLPFYPGYCVLDAQARSLHTSNSSLPPQSFYGQEGLRLAMKLVSRTQRERRKRAS